MARATIPPIEIEVAGRAVRITSPTKMYFAGRGLTKLDIVNYFLSVDDGIMRALRNRPTTLERWRDGVFEGAKLSTRADNTGDAFYSKRVPKGAPDFVQSVEITFPSGPNQTKTVTGQQYLNHMALPNFFFHCATAYDILRHNGVELGKRDFLGAS